MTMSSKSTDNYTEALITGYYYVLIADGKVDPKELHYGKAMIEKEGITLETFESALDKLSKVKASKIMDMLLEKLDKLEVEKQTRVIAYMIKVSNADGERDASEISSIQDITNHFSIHINDIISMKEKIA